MSGAKGRSAAAVGRGPRRGWRRPQPVEAAPAAEATPAVDAVPAVTLVPAVAAPPALRAVLALAACAALLSACARASTQPRPVPVGPAEAPEVAAEIHWREYRLPLRIDHLVDVSGATADFWTIAARVAERSGARVEHKRAPFRPSRDELVVLDTADRRFRAQGLVLRRRGREEVPGGAPTVELTLESRTPDIRAAHRAPLRAADGYPSTLRFKEEVLIDPARPGEPRSVFVLESTVRRPARSRDLTVGHVVEAFPGIAGRVGDPATPLVPVDGVRLERIELELGRMSFGSGTTVRPSIVVWRDRRTRQVLSGEYTFTEKITDYAAQPSGDVRAVRGYFAALQQAAGEWVAANPTKVAGAPDLSS